MKTFRRIFRWITVFALFLTLMAPVFAAQDYGITWDLTKDGVLTIEVAGEMNAAPWQKHAEKIKKVIIAEGVTSICDSAFSGCKNLSEVILPESLQKIGSFAFASCSSLKEIHIPAGVDILSGTAFRSAKNLERITVSPENRFFVSDALGVVYTKDFTMLLMAPEGLSGSYRVEGTVQSVGGTYEYRIYSSDGYGYTEVKDSYLGFLQCEKLTSIEICEGVERLGSQAFNVCNGLTEVSIPDSTTVLDSGAFRACRALERIHFGKGLKEIGGGCFMDADSLKEVTIPGNVLSVGSHAFDNCDVLEKVVLEPGITRIGSYAFFSCPKLTEIQLPSTLRTISEGMLRNCDSLKSVTIPVEVRKIEAHAFNDCQKLRDVTFEGNAPTFGEVAFVEKGLYFHYPEGNETWEAIVGTKPGIYASITWKPYVQTEKPEVPPYLVDWGRKEETDHETYVEWEYHSSGVLTIRSNRSIRGINGTPWGEYYDEIKKVVIEEGCLGIGEDTFRGYPVLEEVVLPDSVKEIARNAFFECVNLKTITIPKGVERIEWSPFNGCKNLERIDVAADNPFFASDSFGVVYSKDRTMLLMAPEGLQGSYRIAEGTLYVGGPDEIHFSNTNFNIYTQGESMYAFRGCSKLKEVWIPDSVIKLRYSAFTSCEALEKVHIGKGVTMIDAHCFLACNSLKELVIPGNVTTIGSRAISNLASLEKLVLEEGVSELGLRAFSYNRSLKEIRLPSTIHSLPLETFQGCSELETITIPASVTAIGRAMFDECEKLREVTFEGNAPNYLDIAFPMHDVTIRYPEGDESWNQYLGTDLNTWSVVTWVPYDAHNWVEATCDTPKTCADCGLIAGEALGHDWSLATCFVPETCTRCGETQGNPLIHKWVEATCTAAKNCTRCGTTEGEALGHDFVDAVCTRCGKPDVPGVLGDVDGDGALSYNDALTVLRASIGLATLTPEQEALADFDGDGGLSYNDALMILRASIGL